MDIIEDYLNWKEKNPDTWIVFTKEQKNILDAIHAAVQSENAKGKKNRHQFRIKKFCFKEFEENLIKRIPEIEQISEFDSLYIIICNSRPKGVGELFCYDVAVRIGCFLKIYPEYVYLHAGTKQGYERLVGEKTNLKKIAKSDLPEPFRSSNLSCHDLEVLFCVYKDKII